MAMDIMNNGKKSGMSLKTLGKLKRATEEVLYESGEKVKDVAIDAHRSVKKNPWAYIGAAFGCALLIGFALGKKK